MPFDANLADRVRRLLIRKVGWEEKRMFGGVGFLLRGNMCVGVWKELLIVRVGADDYEDALAAPHVAEFAITGRPMRGWVMVGPEGVERETDLQRWVDKAVAFVDTLPTK